MDQVTKALAVANLTPGEYVPLLGDAFGLMLVYNPGAAFSFATGSTWIFTIVATVVTVVIIRVARRLGSLGWALALGALLGGNLGNLMDRLFRDPGFARGHVVDFLDYGGLFVGNVADIAIVLGAAGMALLAFLGIGVDGVRHHARTEDGDDAEREPRPPPTSMPRAVSLPACPTSASPSTEAEPPWTSDRCRSRTGSPASASTPGWRDCSV